MDGVIDGVIDGWMDGWFIRCSKQHFYCGNIES